MASGLTPADEADRARRSQKEKRFWREGRDLCLTSGAALGRIATLRNSVRTGKQFCPDPTTTHRIATASGQENKLVGKTGEACAGATPSSRERRGS